MNIEKVSERVCVVRCDDCKYGEPYTIGDVYLVVCTRSDNPAGCKNWHLPPEWFCADGERRED